jgi:uncharacterized phage-associated protein
LVKLLYLAERLSFSQFGEPLTGDYIVSMPHGPVLSTTYNHINGAIRSLPDGGWDSWISDRADNMVGLRDRSMLSSPAEDLLQLSDGDLEVLEATWAEFGRWDRWRLVDYTHSDACPEWKDPLGSSQPIQYHDLFTCLGYSEQAVDALVARLDEQRNLNAAFAH